MELSPAFTIRENRLWEQKEFVPCLIFIHWSIYHHGGMPGASDKLLVSAREASKNEVQKRGCTWMNTKKTATRRHNLSLIWPDGSPVFTKFQWLTCSLVTGCTTMPIEPRDCSLFGVPLTEHGYKAN